MIHVARGEGLPVCENILENEVQDIRGRLAGMLIFGTLDPSEDLQVFSVCLEALLGHRVSEEHRTNWNYPPQASATCQRPWGT